MKKYIYILLLILAAGLNSLYSQKEIFFHLKQASRFLKNNPDSSAYHLNKAWKKAEKNGSDSIRARTCFLLGRLSFEKGDYSITDSFFRKAEKYLAKQSNPKLIADIIFSKGGLQAKLGNPDKAMKLYIDAKKQYQKLKDTLAYDEVDMAIAIMHMEKNDLEQAKGILKKLISKYGDLENDPLDLASTFGFLKYSEQDLDSALYFFNKALAAQQKAENYDGVAVSYNNLGQVLIIQKKYEEARLMFEKSLVTYQSIHSKHGEAFARNALGQALYYLERTDEAIEQLTRAYELSARLGLKSFAALATKRLSNIYSMQGDYQTAFEMLSIHKAYNDSMVNEGSEKTMRELQAKFDFEKQESEMAALKEKERLSNEDREKSKSIFQLMVAVVVLVGMALVFAFIGYRNNRSKNKLLELKNMEIAQQNKEIKDSINYAKRIQKAILPPDHFIANHFPDSFVFYAPKDIVSGDFYWCEKLQIGNDKEIICLAAADCTGHGVPGAMVSVVCHNALNRSIHEFAQTDPGKILDKTREIVVSEFEKSDTDVKDGMDISLISIAYRAEKQNENEASRSSLSFSTLSWAGANNPLWIVRNGEIIEYRPNKQPIGKYENPLPFTSHEVQIEKGDSLYLFTDGLVDQFGGPKGKKMKIDGLKKLILSIHDLPMKVQLQKVKTSFEEWKGTMEQIDDVCVIGVRL